MASSWQFEMLRIAVPLGRADALFRAIYNLVCALQEFPLQR